MWRLKKKLFRSKSSLSTLNTAATKSHHDVGYSLRWRKRHLWLSESLPSGVNLQIQTTGDIFKLDIQPLNFLGYWYLSAVISLDVTVSSFVEKGVNRVRRC